MNTDRWNYIKSLKPTERTAHVSKTFNAMQMPDKTIRYVPNPGVTLETGRNIAKRKARAKGLRHIGKAKRLP